jgi:hypothetical protein
VAQECVDGALLQALHHETVPAGHDQTEAGLIRAQGAFDGLDGHGQAILCGKKFR